MKVCIQAGLPALICGCGALFFATPETTNSPLIRLLQGTTAILASHNLSEGDRESSLLNLVGDLATTFLGLAFQYTLKVPPKFAYLWAAGVVMGAATLAATITKYTESGNLRRA